MLGEAYGCDMFSANEMFSWELGQWANSRPLATVNACTGLFQKPSRPDGQSRPTD